MPPITRVMADIVPDWAWATTSQNILSGYTYENSD
jgi:hypothetical protein